MDVMGLLMLFRQDPNAALGKILKLPIKKYFTQTLSYQNLGKTIAVLSNFLALQLYYSKRTRSMLRKTIHTLLFGFTFFGLIVVLAMLFVKMKFHKKENQAAQQRNQLN